MEKLIWQFTRVKCQSDRKNKNLKMRERKRAKERRETFQYKKKTNGEKKREGEETARRGGSIVQ